jgi:hypothetical protein
MRRFQFFKDNQHFQEEPEESEEVLSIHFDNRASWMWRSIPRHRAHELISESHYGIHSFLSQFPPTTIVSVISIEGPNNEYHNRDNDGEGWGFDISRDLITITWIRFLE